MEGEGRDRRDEKSSVYHFVHEPYPYERWRGHSTIFLHVSTRRDDLEGSRVEGFGAFLDFLGRLGLISKIVGSDLVSKSGNRLIKSSRWVSRLHLERFT